MDNFVVPRLWRGNSPQICGEPQVGGVYSNTGVATETHGSLPKGVSDLLRTPFGGAHEARRAGAVVRGEVSEAS